MPRGKTSARFKSVKPQHQVNSRIEQSRDERVRPAPNTASVNNRRAEGPRNPSQFRTCQPGASLRPHRIACNVVTKIRGERPGITERHHKVQGVSAIQRI